MTEIPIYLRDAKDCLSEEGFATSDVWYHGTSSALLVSIQQVGLKRSGDKAMKQVAKSTMATIGNSYTETREPIFLSQSRELAYYWAQQAVSSRRVRFDGEEEPVVLALKLPEELRAKIKPDVGAASLLLMKDGEQFMAHLAGIYQACGGVGPDIDLMKAGRLEYLNKLGMAYFDGDISAEFIALEVG